ncbi:MAG: Lrp/AsnC family transcriptional regulator, partial [Spirochaetales bacterium]|nr:Lrp/AsnC family transcriptional regulator [Spirochaetales bacterium]
MKIDDTNLSIIKLLREGRKSYKVMAEELSLTENTVRSRVNKLISENVLKITGLIDPAALPGHQVIIVALKLDTVELKEKARELSQLRGVVSASVTNGRYDCFLYVLLSDEKDFGLHEFLDSELAKVDRIKDYETFVVYKSVNLKIP